ncbi:MAG: hypothetical protein FD143_3428, partial [Ignavibacteria bacterium]
ARIRVVYPYLKQIGSNSCCLAEIEANWPEFVQFSPN